MGRVRAGRAWGGKEWEGVRWGGDVREVGGAGWVRLGKGGWVMGESRWLLQS